MSQPAISKHRKVLERAVLTSRGRDAQRLHCRLEAKPLPEATGRLEDNRQFWESNYQRLDHTGTLSVGAPSRREIAMTRVFEAPRALVFEAMTTPALVRRWLLGPPGWTMEVCEIDLKVGGSSRYVWRNSDGRVMGMHGIYREIVAPERCVQTESFDQPWYPGEALVTSLWVEQAGRTTLTTTVRYEPQDIRDSILKSNMADGVTASYNRLAERLTAPKALEEMERDER